MSAPRVGRPTSPTPSAPLPAWQAEGRSRASRRGWPGVSGGLDLGGPRAARRATGIGADVGSVPQATPILLTQLPTTNLDELGRGWNCHVTMECTSGPYGQRRPHLDEPDLATDQKVGGSSPSERAQVKGPLPDPEGAFLVPLGATLGATGTRQPPNRARVIDSAAPCRCATGAARSRRGRAGSLVFETSPVRLPGSFSEGVSATPTPSASSPRPPASTSRYRHHQGRIRAPARRRQTGSRDHARHRRERTHSTRETSLTSVGSPTRSGFRPTYTK